MSSHNKQLIRKLIDLGADVSGHRVNGANKIEIKKNIKRIIEEARARNKKTNLPQTNGN